MTRMIMTIMMIITITIIVNSDLSPSPSYRGAFLLHDTILFKRNVYCIKIL